MSDTEYECSMPFWIDNGELDGLSPENCFVTDSFLRKVEGS